MNQEQPQAEPQPEPTICSICLDAINENNHTLECGHSFHLPCVMQHFRRRYSNGNCPNCRHNPSTEQSTPSRTNTGVIFISNDRNDIFRNNYFRDEFRNVFVNNINNVDDVDDDLIRNFLSFLDGSNEINIRNNEINRRDNNRSNSSNVIDIAGNIINITTQT